MRASLVALLPLITGGCDLLAMAQSTVIVSGLVVASPELKHAGAFEVEAEVMASAWVGERPSATSTAEPKPLGGLAVSVAFDGQLVRLAEDPEQRGLYRAESTATPNLTYEQGADYHFEAVVGSSHGGSATAPLRLDASALHLSPTPTLDPAAPELAVHPRGKPLTVSWDAAHGAIAFVTVLRADPEHPEAPVVAYDTRPADAEAAIRLYTGEPTTRVQIPADALAVDGVYAIIVFTADKGAPETNTFLGSPFLAGSGAAVLLAVASAP